ncbi:MAG: hypothetical protein M1617_03890 [Actinobacteria bacterium]|nr:hypothetical protein [Actinomycetota bacterium]MCL5887432.1 hypothetical protein [Actinomycetota bacterium]
MNVQPILEPSTVVGHFFVRVIADGCCAEDVGALGTDLWSTAKQAAALVHLLVAPNVLLDGVLDVAPGILDFLLIHHESFQVGYPAARPKTV